MYVMLPLCVHVKSLDPVCNAKLKKRWALLSDREECGEIEEDLIRSGVIITLKLNVIFCFNLALYPPYLSRQSVCNQLEIFSNLG